MRRLAHAFLTAGNNQLGIAATNGLNRHVHGFEAGTADLVDGDGWHARWQAGINAGLARRVLAAACSENLSHDDFVDLVAGNARFFD